MQAVKFVLNNEYFLWSLFQRSVKSLAAAASANAYLLCKYRLNTPTVFKITAIKSYCGDLKELIFDYTI